jgi:signal transduction histidine kinase
LWCFYLAAKTSNFSIDGAVANNSGAFSISAFAILPPRCASLPSSSEKVSKMPNVEASIRNAYQGHKDNPENFKNITQKISNILSDAIADVRTLSHQMMPNMLIKNSLANALRDLIEKTSTPKLAVNLQIEGLETEVEQNIQVTLYRIIQECINNTVKHSGADKIDISVRQSDKKITTEIKDNGKGFNPLKISENKDGIGLQNMKARIKMLKGKMRIDSAADRGTQVFIEIPIV